MSEIQNYLGRCREKDCGYALFTTASDVVQSDNFKDVKAGDSAVRVGNNGVFGRCANRHKFFPLNLVKGTYSPDHKCDSRCLNAKGHTCTCSCGGANHGRGHVAVTVASNLPDVDHDYPQDPAVVRIQVAQAYERLDAGFIGEVGKTIRGDVTVKHILRNVTSTVVTFWSDKGHIIKWFAPSYVIVDFEVGEKLTIRAMVKRHEDAGRFGRQTVVTYVERVS